MDRVLRISKQALRDSSLIGVVKFIHPIQKRVSQLDAQLVVHYCPRIPVKKPLYYLRAQVGSLIDKANPIGGRTC